MKRRNPNIPQKRATAAAEANPLSWRYFIVMIICGVILAAGFFLAARQHFSSMEYGIKNSRLRKQLEDLESENRRLLLAREVTLSPAEIKKTARGMGFKEAEVAVAILPAPSGQNGAKNTLVARNANAGRSPLLTNTASVTKTVSQRPVDARPEKAASKKSPVAGKKNFNELTAIARLR